MNKRENLPDTKEDLENEIQLLKKQIHQLQLEKDILEKTAELIKKEPGINLKQLSNSEKAELVGALRDKYRLTELLSYFNLSKSSYLYKENCMRRADKYEKLKVTIINIFEENEKRYGYRRIHLVLRSIGIIISDKVVRRIMNECFLKVYRPKKRKYSSYLGEIGPGVENLIKREFHADSPNAELVDSMLDNAM